jgi:uncharacterized protein (DUF2384 family)
MDVPPKTVAESALELELAATFASTRVSDRWLEAPNPILAGDRPIDCLKRHEYDGVHAALEAFNSGVYI